MELAPVGLIENPEELDLDPIVIPVVGYRIKNHAEVIEKFSFRPVLPWGAAFNLMESTEGDGGVRAGVIARYVQKCLMPEDRERWTEFLDSDEVIIEQKTITDVFNALIEVYGARPTMPRSASSGGGATTKRTSQAASRARASRSKKSR